MEFTNRVVVAADVPELTALMDQAIGQLQRPFLDDAHIASSRAIMGIDSQLIEDGTYFVVHSNADIAGCGAGAGGPPSTAATKRPVVTATSSTQHLSRRAFGPCTRIQRTPAVAWVD